MKPVFVTVVRSSPAVCRARPAARRTPRMLPATTPFPPSPRMRGTAGGSRTALPIAYLTARNANSGYTATASLTWTNVTPQTAVTAIKRTAAVTRPRERSPSASGGGRAPRTGRSRASTAGTAGGRAASAHARASRSSAASRPRAARRGSRTRSGARATRARRRTRSRSRRARERAAPSRSPGSTRAARRGRVTAAECERSRREQPARRVRPRGPARARPGAPQSDAPTPRIRERPCPARARPERLSQRRLLGRLAPVALVPAHVGRAVFAVPDLLLRGIRLVLARAAVFALFLDCAAALAHRIRSSTSSAHVPSSVLLGPCFPRHARVKRLLDDAQADAVAQRPPHFAVAQDALGRLPQAREADLLLAQAFVEQAADGAEAEGERHHAV